MALTGLRMQFAVNFTPKENLDVSIFCGHKISRKYKGEDYPLFSFDGMTNGRDFSTEFMTI